MIPVYQPRFAMALALATSQPDVPPLSPRDAAALAAAEAKRRRRRARRVAWLASRES